MYYYVFSFSKEAIVNLRESCEEEYLKITELTRKVTLLYVDARKIGGTIRAYNNIKIAADVLINGNPSASEGDMNDLLSDYLFRVRKLLDNWATHIKRTYGEASSFYKKFKDAAAYEYDTHMEYRIMYQLRNYDQHCGSIVSSISKGVLENGVKYINVYANRDRLLNDYKKWKDIEKNDLALLNDEINVFDLLDKYHECIMRIHQTACEFHMGRQIYTECAELLKYSNEYMDNRETLCFVKQNSKIDKSFWLQPKYTIDTTSWGVSLCYKLLLLHIRNNAPSVRVLICGDKYKALLKDAALSVDRTTFEKLSCDSAIQINGGNKYIRECIHIEMDKGEGWALLLDARFEWDDMKRISNDMRNYISAILGS